MSEHRKELVVHRLHRVFGHIGLERGVSDFHLHAPELGHRSLY
jgi:hypothetical protein